MMVRSSLRFLHPVSLLTMLTGWLCEIELSKDDEIKELMDAEAYKAHCEGKN